MNLWRSMVGVLRVLGPTEGWEDYFDLSKRGFKQSFIAVALTLPFYYICALGVEAERARLLEAEAPTAIPIAAFGVILVLYTLTFTAVAHILSLVFDRQDRFRPWAIVRHWTLFFMTFLAALAFGGYLLGLLPFGLVNSVAFTLYLGLLAVDIRLGKRIGGFDWGGAVLAGCLIHGVGLTIILAGVLQLSA